MGFRQGAYCKVWKVQPVSNTATTLRISISRKNKKTNEYEQDFSGFVTCVGTACADKAIHLKEGDRVKIGDCDVTTRYDTEKKITYTNYKIFSFEEADGSPSSGGSYEPSPEVDSGEIEEDHSLPF